jgi:IS4 transposase
VIELAVFVGQAERLPCRLIGYRLPPAVVNERRRKARAKAIKKGRALTQETLAWLEFAFFITTVPATLWPAAVIGTIYRLRWQVELTFKRWKSLLALHVLKGTRPERIRCLL